MGRMGVMGRMRSVGYKPAVSDQIIFGVVVMNLAAHPETTKISPEFSRQDDYDYEKNG